MANLNSEKIGTKNFDFDKNLCKKSYFMPSNEIHASSCFKFAIINKVTILPLLTIEAIFKKKKLQ